MNIRLHTLPQSSNGRPALHFWLEIGPLFHHFMTGWAPDSVYNAGLFAPILGVEGRARIGLWNGGGLGHWRWQWDTSWRGKWIAGPFLDRSGSKSAA